MSITPYTAEEVTLAPPEVALNDLPLAGEPATDRGYVTESGTKIRARLLNVWQHETRAPINGDEDVAPSGWTLSLTLAKLNDDHSVAADVNGGLLISDHHEVTIASAMLTNPAFDVQAFVESNVRQQAHEFERRLANRAAVTDYLAQHWGGAMMPPPPEPEPIPDPAEPVAATA